MKSKVQKSSAGNFAKGGSGHMVGKQAAAPKTPGNTAGKSGAGGKFAKGGSGKMFGKQSATPKRSGVTGK